VLDHTVAYVALLALLAEPLGYLRGAALPTAAAHNPGPVPAAVCQVLPRTQMRLRLSLFDEGDRLNADTISQHVSQIWRAEGLALEWLPLDAPPSWTNLDAWVQIRRGPVVGAESSIGAVRFQGQVPSKLIQVSIANTAKRVVANLATRWRIELGAFFSLQVADSRQVLERALGFAVAHELGHYVLATKSHAGSGLMRQSFDPAADLAPRSTHAALDPKNRARLRQRIDLASQCQAASPAIQERTQKGSR
jgi:hypothetical protein